MHRLASNTPATCRPRRAPLLRPSNPLPLQRGRQILERFQYGPADGPSACDLRSQGHDCLKQASAGRSHAPGSQARDAEQSEPEAAEPADFEGTATEVEPDGDALPGGAPRKRKRKQRG